MASKNTTTEHYYKLNTESAQRQIGILNNSFVGALKSGVNTIIDFERANSQLAAVVGTNLNGVKA